MCIFSSLSCINEERSRLTHLSPLIKYNYRSLAGITKILPIIKVVQPRPNIRSNSVLFKHVNNTFESEKEEMKETPP